jgi:hypothetical protein
MVLAHAHRAHRTEAGAGYEPARAPQRLRPECCTRLAAIALTLSPPHAIVALEFLSPSAVRPATCIHFAYRLGAGSEPGIGV